MYPKVKDIQDNPTDGLNEYLICCIIQRNDACLNKGSGLL